MMGRLLKLWYRGRLTEQEARDRLCVLLFRKGIVIKSLIPKETKNA